MERQEIEEIQSALDGEREHSAFLEKLLKVLYGDGWNKLTLFDAKKIYEHNKALETRLKEVEEMLNQIFNLGHNNDCIFCGLKDKEALKGLGKEI